MSDCATQILTTPFLSAIEAPRQHVVAKLFLYDFQTGRAELSACHRRELDEHIVNAARGGGVEIWKAEDSRTRISRVCELQACSDICSSEASGITCPRTPIACGNLVQPDQLTGR